MLQLVKAPNRKEYENRAKEAFKKLNKKFAWWVEQDNDLNYNTGFYVSLCVEDFGLDDMASLQNYPLSYLCHDDNDYIDLYFDIEFLDLQKLQDDIQLIELLIEKHIGEK